MTIKELEDIRNCLLSGSLRCMTTDNYVAINSETMLFLANQNPSADDLKSAELILQISNIIYNNSTKRPYLDDSTYDILLEAYRNKTGTYPVGAPPVHFNEELEAGVSEDKQLPMFYRFIQPNEYPNLAERWYYEDIQRQNITENQMLRKFYRINTDTSRISRDTSHNYPELVGTLDKCKFVMNYDARNMGVFEDDNVKIFERDFLQKHLQMGIIQPGEVFTMIAELKYDGISVEADVSDHVISARTRGDTENDLAADLTPILYGYPFSNPLKEVFGVKFEAIISQYNLFKFSQFKGKEYKNCRNAIVGIVGALDGPQYRDLITLVPLACTTQEGYPFRDRIEEIEFMNKYFNAGINLKYAVLKGTYEQILYQVKQFAEEAYELRSSMPFMYDGIVISYLDRNKIARLGRENSVNKWQVAVKFPSLTVETVFTGYDYTVGQNGVITPMINYLPVEFYGTIHTKSSGHSYARFKELNLRPGEIIQVQYVNDVMPYVTKIENNINANNPNEPVKFIENCPSCGSKLILSDSGKTIMCPNKSCPERNLMRMTSFLDKMNVKDFSAETLRALGVNSFKSLMDVANSTKPEEILGEVLGAKFHDRINEMLQTEIMDYDLIGSIGFTSIAKNKWKLILNRFTIDQILELYPYGKQSFCANLVKIDGIGQTIAETIFSEMQFFLDDIVLMQYMFRKIHHVTEDQRTMKIRFTGFRDIQLVAELRRRNPSIDIGEGSVTKDTNILLVPGESFNSTKVDKAKKYGVRIVPINEFRANIDSYVKM